MTVTLSIGIGIGVTRLERPADSSSPSVPDGAFFTDDAQTNPLVTKD
jgi:hypothetical protein